MNTYVAHIWKDSNDTYSVDFPDLPGCFSSGETLDEAKAMAREALTGYLECIAAQKKPFPRQNYFPVEPALGHL